VHIGWARVIAKSRACIYIKVFTEIDITRERAVLLPPMSTLNCTGGEQLSVSATASMFTVNPCAAFPAVFAMHDSLARVFWCAACIALFFALSLTLVSFSSATEAQRHEQLATYVLKHVVLEYARNLGFRGYPIRLLLLD
jgi:hypothetical protein